MCWLQKGKLIGTNSIYFKRCRTQIEQMLAHVEPQAASWWTSWLSPWLLYKWDPSFWLEYLDRDWREGILGISRLQYLWQPHRQVVVSVSTEIALLCEYIHTSKWDDLPCLRRKAKTACYCRSTDFIWKEDSSVSALLTFLGVGQVRALSSVLWASQASTHWIQ